jgi:hypothetical protein
MTKEIEMLEPYPFYGTTLLKGASYKIGALELLTEDAAKRLIEEGWAKEVA